MSPTPFPSENPVQVEQAGAVAIVRFTCTALLGIDVVEGVGQVLDGLAGANRQPQIVVNLDRVTQLSSAMLSKLMTHSKCADEAGGRLILCEIPSELHRVLELSGLDRWFTICRDEPEALAQLAVTTEVAAATIPPEIIPRDSVLHLSTRYSKAFWRVWQFALTLSVVGWLLVGAVFFVVTLIAVSEHNRLLFLEAFLGGFASFVFARFAGECVSGVKRKLNELAIAECAESIRHDSPDAATHYNRGFAGAQRREFAKAIAHFDAAIRLDRTMVDAHVGRVNAYGALGQFGWVIAQYTKAIELDPNDAIAYGARATAYNGTGRFDLAIPDATEAIRLEPRLYLGHDARGWGFVQQGGVGHLLAGVGFVWWLITFGFLRRGNVTLTTLTTIGSKDDYGHAVADFSEAIQLKPTAWDCYQGRARAYRGLGDLVAAAADETRVRGITR